MRQFWVVGGTYKDSSFSELATGTKELREGPFQTYADATKAWQSYAWSTVDDALAQYHIEEEDLADLAKEPTFWVLGGTYSGEGFDQFDGAPQRFGPYKTYEEAKGKWSELAWQTVDDATARYRIETLQPQESDEQEARLRYRLLTGADDDAFCIRVSQAISDGYKLYGSPSISNGPEGTKVCQAVVLKDEAES